jgi:hypothetical protein
LAYALKTLSANGQPVFELTLMFWSHAVRPEGGLDDVAAGAGTLGS